MRLGNAVIGFSLAALAGAQQMPTIQVPVRLVTVPTLVFSKEGRMISGLQRTDFRVFDKGRLQNVAMDTASAPVSVVIAMQANQDVREYLPFMVKTGSTLDAQLVGEAGEAAVITYSGKITVVKPFNTSDVQGAMGNISVSGTDARMIDAGMRGIALLKERPSSRARVLLFIGQPVDSGSESRLVSLRQQAERENVSIYGLALPELGKAFVSDTVSLDGLPRERGGFKAGIDLGKLISTLNRSRKEQKGADPFSILTAATGGTLLHFRKQSELENAIAAIGMELRSAYLLSYSPDSAENGYHTIKVKVEIPGAKTYARPGYWLSGE
jgi:VWFA-related protein